MALNGTRNRKAATPVNEEAVTIISHSSQNPRQTHLMRLKRWEELRMFIGCVSETRIANLHSPLATVNNPF
jgi:hypothetical protein